MIIDYINLCDQCEKMSLTEINLLYYYDYFCQQKNEHRLLLVWCSGSRSFV